MMTQIVDQTSRRSGFRNKRTRSLLGASLAALLAIPALVGVAGSPAFAADIVTNPAIGPTTGGTVVQLPAETSIEAHSASIDASYFISDGVVFALGTNARGALGTVHAGARNYYAPIDMPEGVHFTDIKGGRYGALALGDDGNVWVWGPDYLSCQTPRPPLSTTPYIAFTPPAGTTVVDMTIASLSALVLLSDGTAYSWGPVASADVLGRGLGPGSSQTATCTPGPVTMPAGVTFDSMTGAAGAAGFVLAIGDNGKMYAWGSNQENGLRNLVAAGQVQNVPVELPMPELPAGDSWKQLSGGSAGAAVTEAGELFLWGGNQTGALGRGQTSAQLPRSAEAVAVNPPGVKFASAHMGTGISFAVATDGELYGWGNNGSLGVGAATSTQVTAPKPLGLNVSSFSVGNFNINAIGSDGKGYASGYANPGAVSGAAMQKLTLVFDMAVTAMTFPAGAGTDFSWEDGVATSTTPAQTDPGFVDVLLDYTNLPWAADPAIATSVVTMVDAFRYYDPSIVVLDHPGTNYSVSETADVIADGEAVQTVTATLVNEGGDPLSGEADKLAAGTEFVLGEGDIGDFEESATAGTYIAEVTSTVAGSAPITVNYSGSGSALAVNPAEVDDEPVNTDAVFVAGPVVAATSDFLVSDEPVTVGQTQDIEVFLNDAFGNPVAGVAESLAASLESAMFSPADATVAATLVAPAAEFPAVFSEFTEDAAVSGRYTATVTSTEPGVATVAVDFGGEETPAQIPVIALESSGNRDARFVAGDLDLDATTLIATPNTRLADGTEAAIIAVALSDEFGNPVVGPDTVELATTLGSIGPVTKTGNGTYTAELTSAMVGTAVVTVTVDDELAAASAEVLFTAVPLAPVPPPVPPVPPTGDPVPDAGSGLSGTSAGQGLSVTGADSVIAFGAALILAAAGGVLLLRRRRAAE